LSSQGWWYALTVWMLLQEITSSRSAWTT
jgi:hypothetical protein